MAREAFVVGAWCGHAMPGTVALRCYYAPAVAVLNTGANTVWANSSGVVGVVLAAVRASCTISFSSFRLWVISM